MRISFLSGAALVALTSVVATTSSSGAVKVLAQECIFFNVAMKEEVEHQKCLNV